MGQRIADNWQLYLLLLIPVVLTFVYKYIPMYGIQIAFRDYKASRGILGSKWVGLEWFERFFTAPTCGRMIRNTILLSLFSLLWGFPVPIILSLWQYRGRVASNHNQYGRMWECPDYFRLDGKDVLFVSPQEMRPIGLEFHAGNGTVCMIGEADENKHLIRENVHAIDYGIDFYAPQTLLTPDGRRIMIAWMQNWDTARSQPVTNRICGQMTLPRELAVRDGRLIQVPVRELENYYGEKISYRNVPLSTETILAGIKGRTLDMTVNVRPANGSSMYRSFRINLAKDGEYVTTVKYKPEQGIVRVDRSRCGFRFDIVHVREFPVYSKHGNIKLRCVLDRHSLELFVNDGEQAASFVLHTDVSADVISFEADGEVLMDVEKYDLVFNPEDE